MFERQAGPFGPLFPRPRSPLARFAAHREGGPSPAVDDLFEQLPGVGVKQAPRLEVGLVVDGIWGVVHSMTPCVECSSALAHRWCGVHVVADVFTKGEH